MVMMGTARSSDPSSAMRPVVVAPTYNNAATLGALIEAVHRLDLPLIVVNDGSTDQTPQVLSRLAGAIPSDSLQICHHRQNQGKAAALRTGFSAARRGGFTHAVTIDTDGQLDPRDIPALLAAAGRQPEALVIGTRDESASGYPCRSRLGRRLSNLMVRIESGLRVADSQCGLRVYPLDLVERAACRAGHFGFETEIITRAGWAGRQVVGVAVSCCYLPPGQRVSHFRPFRDTLRAMRMHARLMARTLAPWPLAPGDGGQRSTIGELWRGGLRWLSPARAWRQVRDGETGRVDFAAGFAVGVFIANLPLYGVQTLLALFAARRLHLNPLSVVAGSHVSTPPIGPVLIAAAIALGHVILHGTWPHMSQFDPAQAPLASILRGVLLEWLVGSVLLGAALSAVAFVVMNCACRAVQWLDRGPAAPAAPAQAAKV